MSSRIFRPFALLIAFGAVGALLGTPAAQAEELRIRSKPSGSALYINGSYRGRTPFSKSLAAGRYHIEVRRKGYLTWTSYIQLPQNSQLVLKAILGKSSDPSYRAGGTRPNVTIGGRNQRRRGGLLIINTKPSGISVYKGSTLLGVTPLLKFMSLGNHTITLRQPGFQEITRQVRVRSSRSVRLKITMTATGGTVRPRRRTPGSGTTVTGDGSTSLVVLCRPKARVYLGTRYLGRTPVISAGIAAGSYQLVLKRKGYRIYRKNIVLHPGRQMRIRARLIRK